MNVADLYRWQYGDFKFEGLERTANGGDEGNYHGPYAEDLLRSVRRRMIVRLRSLVNERRSAVS